MGCEALHEQEQVQLDVMNWFIWVVTSVGGQVAFSPV
jgi:hypothetical protein